MTPDPKPSCLARAVAEFYKPEGEDEQTLMVAFSINARLDRSKILRLEGAIRQAKLAMPSDALIAKAKRFLLEYGAGNECRDLFEVIDGIRAVRNALGSKEVTSAS